MYFSLLESPIGTLQLFSNGDALTAVYMAQQRHQKLSMHDCRLDDGLLRKARQQLQAYFAGELQQFDLQLAPSGSDFQKRVWHSLQTIPYGRTESYGDMAARIGRPTASRAVGMANGRNPLSIVIPCHRVIGSNGALTGYGGGLERKKWLLAHEARLIG